MAEFVNQHIVSKRYLDRFAKKQGKKYIIGTRYADKSKPSFFLASTDNVGYIKNYYDVTDKADPKYWEHFFAETCDSLCGSPLGRIISAIMLSAPNDAIVLDNQAKDTLAQIIISQLLRVPGSIDYSYALYPEISKKVKKSFRDFLPHPLPKRIADIIESTELTPQMQKETYLNHTFDPEKYNKYCDILKNGIWTAIYNRLWREYPFITSDNPVLVESIGKKSVGLFKNGLINPTTCIFFPLSPSIAVQCYPTNDLLKVCADRIDGRRFPLDEIEFIACKNNLIMDQAHKYTFLPQPQFEYMRQL